MRISCAVPGNAQHDGRDRQVLDEVPDLRRAPGRFDEIGRKEAAHVRTEVREADVHDHERQQEPGNGEPDEADERERIVQERIGVDRGVDPDGQVRCPR